MNWKSVNKLVAWCMQIATFCFFSFLTYVDVGRCSGVELAKVARGLRDVFGCQVAASFVVLLEPEAELEAVVERLILPGDILVGVEQTPHVVAAQLPTNVGAQVASWVLHSQHVRPWFGRTRVAATHRGTVGVGQSALALAKCGRAHSANAQTVVCRGQRQQIDGRGGLVLVV